MLAILFACLLVLGRASADIVSPTAGSTASNQQTVATAPTISLNANNPNGPFSSFPLSLFQRELLGPLGLYHLYSWESALDAYLPNFEPPGGCQQLSMADILILLSYIFLLSSVLKTF